MFGPFPVGIAKDQFAQKSLIRVFMFFLSNFSLCPYFSFLLIDHVHFYRLIGLSYDLTG